MLLPVPVENESDPEAEQRRARSQELRRAKSRAYKLDRELNHLDTATSRALESLRAAHRAAAAKRRWRRYDEDEETLDESVIDQLEAAPIRVFNYVTQALAGQRPTREALDALWHQLDTLQLVLSRFVLSKVKVPEVRLANLLTKLLPTHPPSPQSPPSPQTFQVRVVDLADDTVATLQACTAEVERLAIERSEDHGRMLLLHEQQERAHEAWDMRRAELEKELRACTEELRACTDEVKQLAEAVHAAEHRADVAETARTQIESILAFMCEGDTASAIREVRRSTCLEASRAVEEAPLLRRHVGIVLRRMSPGQPFTMEELCAQMRAHCYAEARSLESLHAAPDQDLVAALDEVLRADTTREHARVVFRARPDARGGEWVVR